MSRRGRQQQQQRKKGRAALLRKCRPAAEREGGTSNVSMVDGGLGGVASPNRRPGSSNGSPPSARRNKRPSPCGRTMADCVSGPDGGGGATMEARRAKKLRRRPGAAVGGKDRPVSSLRVVVVPPSPVPLAVYQPASLFAMLLVASLLPRNTFSLRWLALSGCGLHEGGAARSCLSVVNNGGGGCRPLFANQRRVRLSSSWLAAAADAETCLPCEEAAEGGETTRKATWDRKVMLALWSDVVPALERAILKGAQSTDVEADDRGEDWSADSVLDMIPRGGASEGQDAAYPGLVNLGNTCYLNAQLQCAYHVPRVRELVRDAKDKVVEVEVEVEVEVDDDEEDEAVQDQQAEEQAGEGGDGGDVDGAGAVARESNDAEEVNAEESPASEAASPSASVPGGENVPELQDDASEAQAEEENAPPAPKPKKTVIRKETREEVSKISYALQALKVTFHSLTHSAGGKSGSTNILCRTLGINPYLQQDGQEFWKLFVPELDCEELTELYSGYFEDYVREIVPGADGGDGMDGSDCEGEEKKEDEDGGGSASTEARERVRTEPFLDLSIPVAEGTG